MIVFILRRYAEAVEEPDNLCCICVDATANNSLACTHAFCEACLDKW